MKYLLLSGALLAAFGVACYYNATIDSRDAASRRAGAQQAKHFDDQIATALRQCGELGIKAGQKPEDLIARGYDPALVADCDKVYKLAQ